MKAITTQLLVVVASLTYYIQVAQTLSTATTTAIVPEVQPAHLARVSHLVSTALGDDNGSSSEESSLQSSSVKNRYASARDAVNKFQSDDSVDIIPQNELVYGELSIPVLATILDAVGVREGDDEIFLDIGSGDGALVLGASLLYATSITDGDDEENCKKTTQKNAIRKAWGVDIVPGLVDRSKVHATDLEKLLQKNQSVTDERGINNDNEINLLGTNQAEVQFLLGDIHTPNTQLRSILEETTLAVCFATTWSAGNAHNNNNGQDVNDTIATSSSTSLQGRKLPKLSQSLGKTLSSGCRVVIIDGKLDTNDGFVWEGDLRVYCPDTAPYSVASLYCKQ